MDTTELPPAIELICFFDMKEDTNNTSHVHSCATLNTESHRSFT